jgi:hypothetical protein
MLHAESVEALTRFLKDRNLEIDNGPRNGQTGTFAIGRNNRTFWGSDARSGTAAVLMSFIGICKRNPVEPFAGSVMS